jgi:hypothetical protein
VITKGYSEISEMQSIEANQIIVFLNSIVQLIMCNLLLYRWPY